MRRRLLLSSLAICLTCILVLCVPLGLVATSLIRQDFTHRLDRNLENVATAIDELTTQGRAVSPLELAALVPEDRRATYTPKVGPLVTAGHTSGAVQTAEMALPSGRLQMQAPLSLLRGRLITIWLLIAGLAMLTLVLAAGLSLWMATRMSRPLRALAGAAAKLGRGDLRPSGTRYRVAELNQLAEELDSSATKLAHLIDDERRFAREASHQLRTPLTSLAVRLEEIRHSSDQAHVRGEAEAGLEQIERLATIVSGVLTHHPEDSATASAIDVADLLAAQEREWQPAFRARDRTLVVQRVSGVRVQATSGGLEQALSTLIDNSLTHGDGTSTVTTRRVGRHVAIDITDEGPGIPEELGQRIFVRDISGDGGTGLGLAIARALIETDGGRLELTQRRPARFTIFLPPATA